MSWRFWLRLGRQPIMAPREAYDRWAPTYGKPLNEFQRLEQDALLELFPEVRGRSVLDAGCGKGRVAEIALARGASRVVGFDASPGMLASGSAQRQGALLVAARIEEPPLDDTTFDLVVCALTLGHVEAFDDALRDLCRRVRPGGHLLISDFHPGATARRWQRSFTDSRNERTYAIEQHLHRFEDYIGGLSAARMVLEETREPQWKARPVVLVLRARKPPREANAQR